MSGTSPRPSAPPVAALVRLAGLGGIGGGLALMAAYLAHPPEASPEIVAGAAWIWIHAGFMASLLAGIFLLVALLQRYFAAGGGVAGFVGFAMALVSLVFVFGLDYAEVFIFPTLAVEFPAVVHAYGDGTSMPSIAFAFPAAGALFLAGFVLFGWELYRTGAVSRGAAALTILGTIVFGIGLSGQVPMIVVRAGAVVYGGGLIWLGLDLWRQRTIGAG
ncbi:MAG: hypothetical protein HKM95_18235 [Inquilinus sp.]|nr:hypothetical protein [Inquilinus sp.]